MSTWVCCGVELHVPICPACKRKSYALTFMIGERKAKRRQHDVTPLSPNAYSSDPYGFEPEPPPVRTDRVTRKHIKGEQ